jgi:uracil-DNA glycosylase
MTTGALPRTVSRELRVLARALEAHRDELAACRRCGLEDASALPIISEARAPRVVLVGQAPGKTETVDPRPFTGRAGRTLFRWLAQAGIEEADVRRHIYIAAVTRCYPGPNAGGRGDRVPSRREQALCAGWLERELALIRPAVIVPVGRLAIDRFFELRPLEQLVGRTHAVRHVGGESVAIPLPHPSGASSWVFEAGHRELLDRALALLRDALVELGIVRDRAEPRPTEDARGERPPTARSVA